MDPLSYVMPFGGTEGVCWVCFATIIILLGFVEMATRSSQESTQRSWSAKRPRKSETFSSLLTLRVPPMAPQPWTYQAHKGPKRMTLVLDLDETLVRSNTEPRPDVTYDMSLSVHIDQLPVRFYVKKRPYLDLFLRNVSLWFEVIVFTASLAAYADPLLDRIDHLHVIQKRYYREHCTVTKAKRHVKDLSRLERSLSRLVIIDNTPCAYSMHEANAVPITSFNEDCIGDDKLLTLLPFLEAIHGLQDVRSVLGLRVSK